MFCLDIKDQSVGCGEVTQYSFDSLSLTPLLAASFNNTTNYSSSFSMSKLRLDESSTINSTTSSKPLTKYSASTPRDINDLTTNFNNNSCNNITAISSSNDEIDTVKITRFKNDAQVTFPPVTIGQHKSVELTLSNLSNCDYVNWKAYSTIPAYVKPTASSDNDEKTSNYCVFLITPSSGVIPCNQTQNVKIEFTPRDVPGVFTQKWEISTRTDAKGLSLSSISSSLPTSFICKLAINGVSVSKSMPPPQLLPPLTNHILKTNNSKTNLGLLTTTTTTSNVKSMLPSYSSSNSMSHLKENFSLNNFSSISASSSASSSCQTNKCCIKEDKIEFETIGPNEEREMKITVHNRHDRKCQLTVLNILEPFHCKHSQVNIDAKHYIKLPIQFRPRVAGDYIEKVLIKVDKSDVPLTCKLIAKCSAKKK
jgi:hypothetical protein